MGLLQKACLDFLLLRHTVLSMAPGWAAIGVWALRKEAAQGRHSATPGLAEGARLAKEGALLPTVLYLSLDPVLPTVFS